jgi:cyanophycin synthetase
MEIAEIRDLDGPNLFLLEPALKLEVDLKSDRPTVAEAAATAFVTGQGTPEAGAVAVSPERAVTLLREVINALHERVDLPHPRIAVREMETPHHVTVAFAWSRRRLAKQIARAAFAIVSGERTDLDEVVAEIQSTAAAEPTADDAPDVLRDAHRKVPVIGITGTNGKTTTTRLIAWILINAGKRVGWTSSSGVLIQGEEVLQGDFTGPAGAARVFEEPDLDVAVLETARGGILLRGLGYESNDVSVVTNISGDHLGLHGVHTVDELARVKRVVAQVTREEGFVVLNADDERVLAMREGLRGRPFLVTRQAHHPEVDMHRAAGGWALWISSGQIHFSHDGSDEVLTTIDDIPMTLGGRAVHMLENALCAAAATLAIGLSIDQVREGLASFRNQTGQNRGRLNVFRLNDATFIVDFAHNPAGLRHLLNLGCSMVEGDGRLIAAIGSAGDRPDETLAELGAIAAADADIILVKDTIKYLRGRETGDIVRLVLSGIPPECKAEVSTTPSEFAAFERALDLAGPGDTVAIMCIEDIDKIIGHLESVATQIS